MFKALHIRFAKTSTLKATLHSPPVTKMQHVAQHVATGTNTYHHWSKLSFRFTWQTEYPNPAQDTAAGTKHIATKKPIQTKRIDIHQLNQLNIMKHDDSDDTSKNMQTNWQRDAKGIGNAFPHWWPSWTWHRDAERDSQFAQAQCRPTPDVAQMWKCCENMWT